MPKLVTWMNNQRVGELTKLANGAHTFKYAPEWLASRYARPLSLSLPLQRGNITSDAVFNFFDNLLPDSPIVRDRIVKRYHAKSRQPFDLLSEIGRDSVGAVTLLPENETTPVLVSIQLLEALHLRWVNTLSAMHETDFSRNVIHPQYMKSFTLWQLLSLYQWHGKHHVAHITQTIKINGWN